MIYLYRQQFKKIKHGDKKMSVKYDDYRVMANRIAYWIIKNNKNTPNNKQDKIRGEITCSAPYFSQKTSRKVIHRFSCK